MEHDANLVHAMINQPLGLLREAQARVARLEAKVAQADFYLAEALDHARDADDMRMKLMTVHATLKEAMKGESELMRLA